MTSGDQVTARVRIVRCPRCHQLLPELPDFTFYKCGGCNATLKAKSQNSAAAVQSNGSAPTTESDHVSDDKDVGSSSNDAIILPSDKSHQNLNNITEKMKSDDNGQGKPANLNSDSDLKNGTESIPSENEPTVLEGGVAEEEINVESLPVGDPNDEGVSSETHEASELEPRPSEINDELLHSTKYPAEDCLPVDGSIISDDEKLDQLPEQRLNFSHNVHQASSDAISEEERARNEFFVRNMMSKIKELETDLTRRRFRSDLSDNNQYIMKGSKRDPFGNRTRFGRERNSSSGLLYATGFQNGYENAKILYPEWNDRSGDRFLDLEEEKMSLFRLIHELQDQLNNSCNFNRNANGFVSGPLTWKARPDELLHSPYLLENLGRHTPAGYEKTRQHRFSRVPLSGGASSSGLQIGRAAYLHPHRQDIHRSMPLHPGLYRFSHDLNFHSSCPSSPQHYLSSQHPVAQWHKSHELHKHSRERHPSAKRRFKPIAGGAPFITCYSCFKPLQIPDDFLLFKRKLHRLRCGACLVVLEFFLRRRNHIVPCMDPPPKENENCSDDDYERIQASASYAASEFGWKQSQKTSKNPAESNQSRGPPPLYSKADKLSMEMNRLPPTAPGSALHRLMGYSSISQIINETGPSETRVQKRG